MGEGRHVYVLSPANGRLRDLRRKVVNRYTSSVGTSRALQTIQNKMEKKAWLLLNLIFLRSCRMCPRGREIDWVSSKITLHP